MVQFKKWDDSNHFSLELLWRSSLIPKVITKALKSDITFNVLSVKHFFFALERNQK